MKKLLVITAGLIALYLLICTIGPSTINIERSKEITAPAPLVFEQINSFHNWNNWSPWYKLDTNAIYVHTGESGVGSSTTWTSEIKGVGNGTEEIIESVENEYIKVLLSFEGQGGATAYFKLINNKETTTTTTWGFEMDVPFFARAIMLLLSAEKDIQENVGKSYEEGLQNLEDYLRK